MLSLSQRQSLQQRLSPQQVQYLKMLQLPIVALEQRIKQELEANPMLEEVNETELEQDADTEQEEVLELTESRKESESDQKESEAQEEKAAEEAAAEEERSDFEEEWEEYLSEQYDDYRNSNYSESDDDDQEVIPQRSETTLADDLLTQLHMQTLGEDEMALAEEIIGNIDEHGYLRRDLAEIIDDLNKFLSATFQPVASGDGSLGDGRFDSYEDIIHESPFGRERLSHLQGESADGGDVPHNGHAAESPAMPRSIAPASETSNGEDTAVAIENMAHLSIEELARMFEQGTSGSTSRENEATQEIAIPDAALFTLEEAERVLHRIQRLDPPGIGSRDLRECLLVQLEIMENRTPAEELAHRVVEECYTEFTMKHFEKITDRLKCTTDELKEAMEVIRGLNPKPGNGSVSMLNDNYLTPDFVIRRDGEDFVITANDRHIPLIRINRAYQELMRRGRAKKNGIDRDTRKFLRDKFEAAKWFIASIQQRRQTMSKVMRAIVDLQRDFFEHGSDHIRPMIYKDVAERIDMDISTVCRVVNGKYVQTDYGTFELRYFFSEKLETTSGEEVSTKIVKSRIQELIAAEDKSKPLSDDAISKAMKDAGYNVARRTVAKYREQMNIPVARLRRGL